MLSFSCCSTAGCARQGKLLAWSRRWCSGMIGGGGYVPWSDPARGGATVTFNEVLSQTIAMLQQHGRVSYRALKRQFAIDDDFLEDLKSEIIEIQQRAADQDGAMLVWTGETGAATVPMPASPPATTVPSSALRPTQEPRAYTPQHLAEKIRTARAALEGERKQVTVLFADLKGSME